MKIDTKYYINILKDNPKKFSTFDKEVRDSLEIAVVAARLHIDNLIYIDDSLKNKKEFIFRMAKNKTFIEQLPYCVKDDENMMLGLCGKNGMNIKFASERLQQSDDFVKKAMQRNRNADLYNHLTPYQQSITKDILLKLRPNLLYDYTQYIYNDMDAIIQMLENYKGKSHHIRFIIEHIPKPLLSEEKIGIYLIDHFPQYYRKIDEDIIKQYADRLLIACNNDLSLLDPITNTYLACLVLKQNLGNISFIHSSVYKRKEIIQFVEENIEELITFGSSLNCQQFDNFLSIDFRIPVQYHKVLFLFGSYGLKTKIMKDENFLPSIECIQNNIDIHIFKERANEWLSKIEEKKLKQSLENKCKIL